MINKNMKIKKSNIIAVVIIAVVFVFASLNMYNYMKPNSFNISSDFAITLIEFIEEHYLEKDNGYLESSDFTTFKNKVLASKKVSKREFANMIYYLNEASEYKYNLFYFNDWEYDNFTRMKEKKDIKINSKIEDENIGYISFDVFGENSGEKFLTELEKLSHLDYLIIDIRNNPGGATNELRKMLNTLTPKGSEIVTLKNEIEELKYFSTGNNFKNFKYVFVWVNEKSASCSEILPLVLLNSLENIEVVGNKTRGKSVGQYTTEYNNRKIAISIVQHYWNVNNKNTDDLNEYLKKYSGVKLVNDEDYMAIVRDIIKE